MEKYDGQSPLQEGHLSPEKTAIPSLSFHIVANEENIPFQGDLSRIQQELDESWSIVAPRVMPSFEEITNGTWNDQLTTQGIAVTLTATEGSRTHPGRYLQLGCRETKSRYARERGLLGTMRDVHSLTGSLIHELGHNFMSREDIQVMRDQFADRFDPSSADLNAPKFFNEVYAELLSQAVASQHFPDEETAPWIARQRVGHRGVYDFLDTLSADERRLILDRNHHMRIPVIELPQDSGRMDGFRTRMKTIFQKKN